MSFSSIRGQERVIDSLRAIIEKDKIAGGYLFTGPKGVGKFMTAIEFAKAINCERMDGDACDECISCKKISSGYHPDINIIGPSEDSRYIKLEKAKDVVHNTGLMPYEGKMKVFIIYDAEYLLEESSNAILKVLEESPNNQIFILVTSRPSAILPTIISRCKILRFNALNLADAEALLVERYNFNRDEAVVFSRLAMGSIGTAIEFKREGILEKRERVLNDFFFKKRAIFSEELLDAGKYVESEKLLFLLLTWYRDIFVSKLGLSRDIFFNIDKEKEIISYADTFSKDELENNIMVIMKTLGYIRRNINSKIALFDMILDIVRR